MANGHGGARIGAGRKAGATDKRKASREIEARVSEALVPHLGEAIAQMQPKDVMSVAMKLAYREFEESKSWDALDRAVKYAEKAAPYINPKLSNRQETHEHNHHIKSMSDADLRRLIAYQEAENATPMLTATVVETEPRDRH